MLFRSVALTVIFTAISILLSEATSNTAAANMIIPIAIAVAQAAGVRPIEPALGATLGSMGIESEIAATGIKNTMLALTKGTAITRSQGEAFQQLGLDAVDVSKRMQKDAGGTILDVMTRISKLPKEMQSATLTNLFGSESIAAIAPLLTQLPVLQDNFHKVGDATKYAGSMQAEFDTRSATSAAKLQLMRNRLDRLKIIMGEKLLPATVALFEKIGSLADRMSAFADRNPGFTKGLVLIFSVVSGLLVVFGTIGVAVGAAIGPFMRFGGVAMTVGRIFITAIGWIIGAVAAVLGIPAWIVAAVAIAFAAIGYLVYRNWDRIKTFFQAGIDKVKALLNGMPGWMKTIGSMMMQGLLMALNPMLLVNKLLSIAKTGITAFKNYFGIKSPSRLFMAMGEIGRAHV